MSVTALAPEVLTKYEPVIDILLSVKSRHLDYQIS
jgi:hypothetical protein